MSNRARTAAYNIALDDPMSRYGVREILGSAKIARDAIALAVAEKHGHPQALRRIAKDREILAAHHKVSL